MPEWIVALAAAALWGGGDFSGGMGVKAAGGPKPLRGALRVVVAAHGLSLAALLLALGRLQLTLGLRGWPGGAPLAWGLGAGVAGGVALTAFYLALSRGQMGGSAALSGVLAAAIPAVVSGVMEGAASALRLSGFGLAAAAIWMIAAGKSPYAAAKGGGGSRSTVGLAVMGGVGFGVYFVALRLANPLGVLEPMALARVGSLGTCGLLLAAVAVLSRRGNGQGVGRAGEEGLRRGSEGAWLSRAALGWAVGVAVLDTGGNLLFVAATRRGRLDVAAVLASLYPASTILLAAWRLHERPTRRQLAGMGVALAAVVMIVL